MLTSIIIKALLVVRAMNAPLHQPRLAGSEDGGHPNDDRMHLSGAQAQKLCDLQYAGILSLLLQLQTQAPLILLSLDFDDPGKKRYFFWMWQYPNLRPWPCPFAKSPGDAFIQVANMQT